MVRSLMAVLALAIFPGLTAGQEPVLQAAERTTLEAVVRFDYDMATITTETDQLLRAKLPILRNTPSITLRLEGHADDRGSIEYNLALGSRRAESVRGFLTGLGISEDRLTTTSFGKERPLVNRSDEAAWAQNRRVEFVITGIPAPIVAIAGDGIPTQIVAVEDVPDPAVEDVAVEVEDVAVEVEDVAVEVGDNVDADDPPDLNLAQPEPAIVGDVTVESPPEVETLQRPVRPRGNSERDRRSRFYGSSLTESSVRASEARDFLWVSRTSTRAAEWLGPMKVEEVEFGGKIESLVVEGDIRTAFPYTWVRLNLEPGFRPRIGDDLQIFRPARVNEELGVVLRPLGVMSVTRVAPNAVEGLVLSVFGLVKVGDLVRPAPVHDLRPGEYPAMVTNRTGANIIEFGEVHQLYGLGQVTILDKGSRDGLDIGDEYVAFSGDGSTEDVIGRLRVVLIQEETASAEIVTVEGVVFQVGTTVYLDRKMR